MGNSVERWTNSGVAAILGIPLCWCGGGAGWRVIKVVVAPGAAWTSGLLPIYESLAECGHLLCTVVNIWMPDVLEKGNIGLH